jgi:hypothetical protein
MREPGHKRLPRAIPAERLQALLDADPAFCSWDASGATLRDLLGRWPFLFSHPLMHAKNKPTQ